MKRKRRYRVDVKCSPMFQHSAAVARPTRHGYARGSGRERVKTGGWKKTEQFQMRTSNGLT